jgi:N-acetylglucosamine kinase-like BadF-type ATPase
MYKIIAESGGTTTTWQLRANRSVVAERKTIGLNPYFVTAQQLQETLLLVWQTFGQYKIAQIDFYGAGCHQEAMRQKIKNALKNYFSEANIQIFTDLEATARALCGNAAGLVAILGTGCHAAYFDGKKIVKEPNSLGFWLGDEGSGGWIGKQLIHDYFLNIMPKELQKEFENNYKPELNTYLERLYKQTQPNQFAAEKAIFVSKNRKHPYCENLVRTGFQQFLTYYVKPIATHSQDLGACGSIAFYFEDILRETAEKNGFLLKKVIQRAMDKLEPYPI